MDPDYYYRQADQERRRLAAVAVPQPGLRRHADLGALTTRSWSNWISPT